MSADPGELLSLLDLQAAGQGVFMGPPGRDAMPRVFGGHVLAQALAAACFSVEGWPCHSLHATFVRPGKPGRPIDYEVAAMRDGRRFATRKVIAVQRDEVNLELIASFQRDDERASAHQTRMLETPAPESFPSEDERIAQALAQAPSEFHALLSRKRPIELIRVDARDLRDTTSDARPVRTWLKTREPLLDDPNLHRCALTYASDMLAIEPNMRALGTSFMNSELQVASLDHAVWFHRPFRCDDWLLCVAESTNVAEGRGFCRAEMFARDGRLVASFAQESVMRPRSEEAEL